MGRSRSIGVLIEFPGFALFVVSQTTAVIGWSQQYHTSNRNVQRVRSYFFALMIIADLSPQSPSVGRYLLLINLNSDEAIDGEVIPKSFLSRSFLINHATAGKVVNHSDLN